MEWFSTFLEYSHARDAMKNLFSNAIAQDNEWIHVSSTNILLSKTGPLGIGVLRHFLKDGGPGLVSRFINQFPLAADMWVGIAPDAPGRKPLSSEQFVSLLGGKQESLRDLARELGVSENDVVQTADSALYQAVQMVSPSGISVSPFSAKQLDEALRVSFGMPKQVLARNMGQSL